MKSTYKIYKRYREDIWCDLAKFPTLSAFLSLRLVLFNKGLYKKKREDFARNFLFKKKNYTPSALVFLNKQKLKFFYCNMAYKQMKNIFLKAQKLKYRMVDSFIGLLESRIDVVLYRANFVNHMKDSVQLLAHKNVFINGVLVSKANYLVVPGDMLSIRNMNLQNGFLLNFLDKGRLFVNFPSYLEVNYTLFTAIFLYRPQFNEVFFPFSVDGTLALQYFKDIT
jgi:small subunit ribosomal protein S4